MTAAANIPPAGNPSRRCAAVHQVPRCGRRTARWLRRGAGRSVEWTNRLAPTYRRPRGHERSARRSVSRAGHKALTGAGIEQDFLYGRLVDSWKSEAVHLLVRVDGGDLRGDRAVLHP